MVAGNKADTGTLAESTRERVLAALADGRALPRGELARAAGLLPADLDAHLAAWLADDWLAREAGGRHVYYRLADRAACHRAAQAALRRCGATLPGRAPALVGPLRLARRCYGHLAGRLGVAVTGRLLDKGWLQARAQAPYVLTTAGANGLGRMGIDWSEQRLARAGLARPCLDRSERLHHLGGPLGKHFLQGLCAQGWLRQTPATRVIEVTPLGQARLRECLQVDVDALRAGP